MDKMSEEEFENLYNNSLKLYKSIGNICIPTNYCEQSNYDNQTESDTRPMHPQMFYRLSNIKGFNNQNGINYIEYIKLWKNRYKIDMK